MDDSAASGADALTAVDTSAAALLDAVGEAVFVTDATGRIVHWNTEAERLFGHRAADTVGRPIRAVTGLDAQGAELDSIGGVLASGSTWRGEFSPVRPDGTRMHVRVTLTPLFVGHEWRATVAVAVDLSALQAARSAERQLAAIVETSDDAIIAVNLDGIVSAWSPGATTMLGWSVAEAVGRNLGFLLPSHRGAEDDTLLAHARLGRRVDRIDSSRLHRDGHEVPLSITVTPLRDGGGAVSGASLIARLRNHDDRPGVAAVDAEVRFRSLLERSSEIVTVCDADGRVIYVSPTVERLLGYPASILMQGEIAPLTLEADVPLLHAAFRAVIADPSSHPVVVYRRHTASGATRWAETTMSNLLDDPIISGIVLNIRDVTEREEARLALQESEERYRSLAQHDLLTGLANRRVFLERLAVACDQLGADGRQPRTAVLFVDLDAFKEVNDTHGHVAGDALLCEIATRLASAVRARDTVARYGGDEFTVLTTACGTDAEVVRFAQRLLEIVRRPVLLGRHRIVCGASIGVAIGPPGTASELMARADVAMYRVKSAGGGAVELDDLRSSSRPA